LSAEDPRTPHRIKHVEEPIMTRFKTFGAAFSAAALLSAALASPVFAQAAAQEPGVDAFYQSLGVVGSGPGPEPVYPSSRGSYGAMAYDNAPMAPEASCTRYRSYDPSSGTFLGRDGRRHPCG
jgi:BA14K-like protein